MSLAFGLRSGQTADMNVTPLIDVLLVLIIIFMVVIPHHSHGEQADIPQAAPSDSHVLPSDSNNVIVQLLDRGEGKRPALKINASELSYEVSWDNLAPKDFVPKDLVPKDLVSKDFVSKDFVSKDFVSKDFVSKDFVSKMREILASRAQRIAFLKADPDVEFEFVAQALDLTRVAGAERVGLIADASNLSQ